MRSIESDLGLTVHGLIRAGNRDGSGAGAGKVEDKPLGRSTELANTDDAAGVVDVKCAAKHPTRVGREQRVEVGQRAVLPEKSAGIIRSGDSFTDDLPTVIAGIGKAINAAQGAHIDQVA